LLILELSTKKHLIVSFWTFIKYLSNHSELEEKNQNYQNFLLMQVYFPKVKLDNSLFCYKKILLAFGKGKEKKKV